MEAIALTNKNIDVYTVSGLSSTIKSFIDNNFENIRLKGEVQGVKIHQSGHVYFSLKDDSSIIDAICWKWSYAKQTCKLKDGIEINCLCNVTTYPIKSKYQIIVTQFDISGNGDLFKILEERKKKLLEEGYFNKKRNLPKLPSKIGVITSESGAVFHDIINRIRERYPLEILLWPTIVQGDKAITSVCSAIKGFNNMDSIHKPDLIIIARGGGSIEDLMPFNSSEIVKAIFSSEIVTISAIGHETDTTLADYAADVRAATPTAAAELAVPVKEELVQKLSSISSRFITATGNFLSHKALRLDKMKITPHSLNRFLDIKLQRVDYAIERFSNTMIKKFDKLTNLLETHSKILESYSYHNVLKRGFAMITDTQDVIIKSLNDASQKNNLVVQFYDGKIKVSL